MNSFVNKKRPLTTSLVKMRLLLPLLVVGTCAFSIDSAVKPSIESRAVLAPTLSLRGGASLGPVTPTVGAWVQVALEVYFITLNAGLLKFLPALPFMGGDPYEKFGWGESAFPTKPPALVDVPTSS